MKASGGRRKNRSQSVMALVVILLLAVMIIAIVWMISGGGGEKGDNPGQVGSNQPGGEPVHVDNSTKKILLNENALPTSTSAVQQVNETGTTVITLNGASADVEGSGVVVDGGYILINRAGVYELSGTLNDGRIVVNAKGEDIVLILNGVDITCSYSSPLYVYKASTVTLIANGTSENTFTDGSDYDYSIDFADAVKAEPDAAVFSKADLIIRGTGSINVKSNYSSAIISKDNLKIVNTTVNVDSANNGINGKDSLVIQNSTVKVNAKKDGLRSTKDNDPALGYAMITGSDVYVSCEGDGIQVETGLTVENSTISIVTGGGAFNDASDSQKGIKCNQGYVDIKSGYLYLDCSDDAFNAAGNVSVSGGVLNISSGDDGIHSDSELDISGGTTVILMCNEGLEGMKVAISGGDVYINSKSDGINAAGGNDSTGFDGGFGGQFVANPDNSISVSGGYIYVDADGDGLDSNGNIYFSGGTLIVVGPTDNGNGALDYNGDFDMVGGTLLAYGSKGMAQAPDNLSQNCVSVTFDSYVKADDYVNISVGKESFTFKAVNDFENMVFSSPMLVNGEECVVSCGGKYSGGENLDGVYSGGKYSGGNDIKLNIEEGLSAYGQIGMGGSMGGQHFGQPGQFGGFRGEGKIPDGQPDHRPPEQ